MSANSLSLLLNANTGSKTSASPVARQNAEHNNSAAPIPGALPPVPALLPRLTAPVSGAPQSIPAPAPSPDQAPAGQGHASTQSLYQCAHCQKRYSRPEHLARHIQTHTLGKRFSCQVCGKAFARADLLKRHTAIHANDNDPSKKRRRTAASTGTGRVSHACQGCANARVKCEEDKPCLRCRKRGLTCEYTSDTGPATASQASQSSDVPEKSPGARQSGTSPATVQSLNNHHPSVPSDAYTKAEAAQLPTPDAIGDPSGRMDTTVDASTNNAMVDMSQMPYSGFLRDVLFDQPLNANPVTEVQGAPMFDFCDDTNYELTDMDFGLLDHWNLDVTNNTSVNAQAITPKTDDSTVDLTQMRQQLVKIWTTSPWYWTPGQRDSSLGEYANLPIIQRDANQFQREQGRIDRVIKDKLDQSSRDKILSIVLQATDSMRDRIAASFPSVEAMDTLTHIFLAAQSCSVSGFIHWGSFKLNKQWPEWLAMAAAGGAVMTPVSTMRKFGFGLQEAVRVVLPMRFEKNNTGIADLGLVQTLVLGQDIGLWSGNRRKMEIAEGHFSIPIAMMRYRGKFQRASYPPITVDAADGGEVLEEKWRTWYKMESWKRLVFHCYLRDAQVSMTTLAPPIMSYAELSMPLPEAKELWFASSAAEWKTEYLMRAGNQAERPPSLADLIRNIQLLTTKRMRLDTQYATLIYLHCFWNLIKEWRQLITVHGSISSAMNYHMSLSWRHQELCRALRTFQYTTSDWHASFSAQEELMFNLMLMNLHVSLNNLQIFGGKEGEDEARRIYPILQQWSESPEARQAIWHAGQILRHAKLFPKGHLKDFYAITVHHAALCLWTYGVVVKATGLQSVSSGQQDMVLLDAVESHQSQRFIETGAGKPSIQSADGQQVQTLDDPKAAMDVAHDILKFNFTNGRGVLPPIVENLCQLIRQLGQAAWAVELG